MASISSLYVELRLEASNFNNGIKAVQRDIKEFEKTVKPTTQALKDMGSSLTSAGQTLSIGLTAPLVAFGAVAVKQFSDSAEAAALMENAIKSTGGAAGKTADELTRMATSLEKGSLFEDDEIIRKVTTNLLTFTNVSGTAFDRAQQAALNLSTVLGQDLQTSAIQVGKALNDPVAGVSALQRVGVKLSDSQKDLVKSFMAVGDIAGAQNVILKELEKEFGGAAAAASQAGTGPIKQLTIQMGNLTESFGKLIVDALLPMVGYVTRAVDWINSMDESTKKVVLVVGALAAAIGPVLIVLGTMASGLASIISVAGTLITVLGGASGVAGAIAAVAAVITGPVGIAVSIGAALVALGVFIAKNKETREMVIDAWEKIKDAFKPLLDEISLLWKEHGDQVIALFKIAWSTIVPVLQTYLGAFVETLKNVVQVITGAIKLFVDALKGDWSACAKDLLQIWTALWDQIKTVLMTPLNAIKGAVTGFTDGVKNAFKGMYDAVVGHSFVPDMVKQIDVWFSKLPGIMVGRAQQAAGGVVSEFSKMLTTVNGQLGQVGSLFGSSSGVGKGIGAAQHGLNAVANFATGNIIGGVVEGIKAVKGAFEALSGIGSGRKAANAFVSTVQDPFGALLANVSKSGTTDDLDAIWGEFNRQGQAFASKGSDEATVVAQAHQTLDALVAQVRSDISGRPSSASINVYPAPNMDVGQLVNAVIQAIQTDAASRALLQAALV